MMFVDVAVVSNRYLYVFMKDTFIFRLFFMFSLENKWCI